MTISRKKQFAITFAAFLVLGASFKVMTLIEGLTEVRPVNAIPPVAGLCFGPVGGLACGLGNLFADFFGEFTWYSFLGMAANFIAAFLPY
jgi:energy-coupling factor transport system substrate-specific component